ncbi:hypothetical protein NIES4103_63620 [Nostoc sp. NIES-4103]|nr:hypothetical protein NIES4103_63620 [Nostoc sp. NIES-4103]
MAETIQISSIRSLIFESAIKQVCCKGTGYLIYRKICSIIRFAWEAYPPPNKLK